MPDLIVHAAAGYLAGRWLKVLAPAAVAGALIPDLLRAFGIVSDLAWPYTGTLHEPLPVLLACVLVSRLFVPGWRKSALIGLGLGAASHLILDILQDHLGWGYFPLFPLSRGSFECAILPPEGHFWAGPALVALCVLVAKIHRRPA